MGTVPKPWRSPHGYQPAEPSESYLSILRGNIVANLSINIHRFRLSATLSVRVTGGSQSQRCYCSTWKRGWEPAVLEHPLSYTSGRACKGGGRGSGAREGPCIDRPSQHHPPNG